jgi:hypothetical protein
MTPHTLTIIAGIVGLASLVASLIAGFWLSSHRWPRG